MIGVGIAGAGFFAAAHVQALAAVPAFRLVAVASEDAASAGRFAQAHGGRVYADWRHLIDDPAVDVVLVTMPHHLHAPVAIAAARAGKHVLVEKPMATSLADCVAMADAAAVSGVQLLVGQLMRFVRPCRAAREVLASGRLGRPLFGRSAMVKCWMESNRRPWHLSHETGGGMLMTAGIHALDRLVWLMDDRVSHVASLSGNLFHAQEVPDADLLSLRFSRGGIASLASVGYLDTTMTNDTEIVCECGTLRLDMERGVTVGQGGHWTEVPGSSEPDWPLRGLEREWTALRDAIVDGAALPVSPEDAGELVSCIVASFVAAAERREVAVPGWAP